MAKFCPRSCWMTPYLKRTAQKKLFFRHFLIVQRQFVWFWHKRLLKATKSIFLLFVGTSWLYKICGRYKSRLHFLINEMNRPLVCRRWCKSQASYLDCPRTYKVSSKRGSPPSPLFALVLRSFVRCSSLSSVILQQCSVLESAGVRSIVGARATGRARWEGRGEGFP